MWTESDEDIDSGADLVEETGLSPKALDDAAGTLGDRGGLLKYNMTVAEDGDSRVTRAQLTSEGFSLAHDRAEAKRNRTAHRSVAALTVILALVGIAQAYALSIQSSHAYGDHSAEYLTFMVGIGLVVTYFALIRDGAMNFK